MNPRPDFIVDPSGTVHDARRLQRVHKVETWPTPAPVPPPVRRTVERHATPRPAQTTPSGIRLIPIPIGLLIALLSMCFSNPRSVRATRYYNQGCEHLEQERYPQAIDAFNQAIDLKPDYGAAYNNRCLARLHRIKYDAALADCSQAIALLPQSPGAYNNRGIIYYHLEEYETAIADFTQAVEVWPTFAKGYYNRGLVYITQDDDERAIADLSQAIERTSTLPYPWPTGYPTPNPDRIREVYEKYLPELGYGADLSLAYACRGLAYARLGRYDQAWSDVEQALEYDPDLGWARSLRAIVYQARNDPMHARSAMNKARELDDMIKAQPELSSPAGHP